MLFINTTVLRRMDVRVLAQSQEDSFLAQVLCVLHNMHVFMTDLESKSHQNSVLPLESSPNSLAWILFITVSFVTRDIPRIYGGQRWRRTSGKVRQSSGNSLRKSGEVFTEKQGTLSTENGTYSEQPQNEQKEKLRITLSLCLSVQHLLPALDQRSFSLQWQIFSAVIHSWSVYGD